MDNIYIRFGTKLYRKVVGIPMDTNCAPLVAYLLLFCYERDFMTSLSNDNQSDIIKAFNSTSRCLDDLLNIDNPYCRHNELVSKFNVGLKSLLQQGLSEPEFYGDLVYKFKKIRGMTDFSSEFRPSNNALQTYWVQSKCNATVCMLSYLPKHG